MYSYMKDCDVLYYTAKLLGAKLLDSLLARNAQPHVGNPGV